MTPMLRLSVAVLLVSGLAHAAAPPGSIKSLGNGKDDDGEEAVAVAKKPALNVVSGSTLDADRGLLRGLLFAFEPAPTEIRVLAVEDLGLLGDSRALNPLAQLVMDSNSAVQAAAVRAIRNITNPRAETILANVVRHPSISDSVKVMALEALLFQNTNTALAFITSISRGGVSVTLQTAARRVMLEVPAGRVP